MSDHKVKILKEHIKNQFFGEATGHDWYHIERVYKLATKIHKKEGGDLLTIKVAALLHDLSDHKFNDGDFEKGGNDSRILLNHFNFEASFIDSVVAIVNTVSFKGNGVADEMKTIEGKIVQDADRLDALGAIGIARTFAYGGSISQPIYDPLIKPSFHSSKEEYAKSKTHTINHFYEKLLLLKDRMHTETARKLAIEREDFMKTFLKQFYNEWEVK